ncbi:DUF3080 family protein [Litchfieldella rifensis]|uniref:DUF3080 family protein n=1 Tax=Litchfieldella rifensis TaxID=762643 RepID=A0ABV7LJB1_9GAMM
MVDWRFPVVDRRCAIHGFTATVLVCSTLLTACGGYGNGDELLVDYQQRLAEVLEVERPEPENPANIGVFPDQEERLFEIPEVREGLLDIYALRECQITSLVARRNNQLGRVAAPSQRWLYELELWRRLYDCWHSEVPESLAESDRERLRRLTETKTEQLPRASWNALFGSSEWVGSFSRVSSPLAPGEEISLSKSLDALNYLRLGAQHQYDPDWQADSSILEGHLQTLQREPLTARILRSLMLTRLRLEEANTILDTALDSSGACHPENGTVAIDRLQEIFQRQFNAEIRPYLNELTHTARAWLEAIDALLEAHEVSRPAIDDYRRDWLSLDNPEAPWLRFQRARQGHEERWQRLKRTCGPWRGGDET